MSEQSVVFEDCGSYACITLNRPAQRNALDRAAQLALQELAEHSLDQFNLEVH